MEQGKTRKYAPEVRSRAVRLSYPAIQVNHQNLSRSFQEWVYEGRTLGDIFRPGFYLGMGVMLIGLCLTWPQDLKAAGRRMGTMRRASGQRRRRGE